MGIKTALPLYLCSILCYSLLQSGIISGEEYLAGKPVYSSELGNEDPSGEIGYGPLPLSQKFRKDEDKWEDGVKETAGKQQQRCSAIIRCLNKDTDWSGSINNLVHQPAGPILYRERCIWVLYAPSATKYIVSATQTDYVDLNSEHFSNASSGVMVTGARHDHDLLTSFYLNGVHRNATLHANIIWIVIWSTGPLESIGRGVVINYSIVDEDGKVGPASSTSVHGLVSPGGNVYHPHNWSLAPGGRPKDVKANLESSATEGRELSTYTFIPHANKLLVDDQGTPLRRITIAYEKLHQAIEVNCDSQRIQIYRFSFRASGFPIWSYYGIICDGFNSLNFTVNDLTLLVVKSSKPGNDPGRQFSLKYSE